MAFCRLFGRLLGLETPGGLPPAFEYRPLLEAFAARVRWRPRDPRGSEAAMIRRYGRRGFHARAAGLLAMFSPFAMACARATTRAREETVDMSSEQLWYAPYGVPKRLQQASRGTAKGNISQCFDLKFNCKGGGTMDKKKDKYQDTLGQTPTIIHSAW